MKSAALNEVRDELSRYLRIAEQENVLITRHGKPAGILIGFASEDEWFDYRLEHDPRIFEEDRTSVAEDIGWKWKTFGRD